MENEKKLSNKEALKFLYGSLGFGLFFIIIIVIGLLSKINLDFGINWHKIIMIGIGALLLYFKKTRVWTICIIGLYFLWVNGTIGRIFERLPWRLIIYGLLIWGAVKILSPKKKSETSTSKK